MKPALFLVLAMFALGCGGPTTPPEEETSAEWTSGDDEPLDAPPDDAD